MNDDQKKVILRYCIEQLQEQKKHAFGPDLLLYYLENRDTIDPDSLIAGYAKDRKDGLEATIAKAQAELSTLQNISQSSTQGIITP